MGTNNGHKRLASTGGAKLTPAEETFAQGLAAGLPQLQAYKKAHPNDSSKPTTMSPNASRLAKSSKILARVKELTAPVTHELQVRAQDLIAKLQVIADAPVQEPVRAADKIAAIDKIAKIAGLYRDDRQVRDGQPIRITHVTVVLSHGKTETHQVGNPDGVEVVEGEPRTVPEDGAVSI